FVRKCPHLVLLDSQHSLINSSSGSGPCVLMVGWIGSFPCMGVSILVLASSKSSQLGDKRDVSWKAKSGITSNSRFCFRKSIADGLGTLV
ncbi:3463_t:CDS:1, partial [Gigaspora rosea]